MTSSYHIHSPHLNPQTQLSLFEQTLRDQEEHFYSVFPDARIAAAHRTQNDWRSAYDVPHTFAGASFHLQSDTHADGLRFNYIPPEERAFPQSCSQSELSYAVDPTPHVHNQSILHSQQVHNPQVPHTDYVTPQLSPVHQPPQPFASAAPLPLQIPTSANNASYQPPYHQFHHQLLPDSLPSPGTPSDTSTTFHDTPQYHSPPPHTYQPTSPFSAIPSPSDPLSPSTLIHSTYINAVNPNPEPQQFFVGVQPPLPQNISIAPSRRNSRDSSARSQRRYTPPYARPHHRSGGSRGPISIPSPNIGWSPTSQPNTASPMGRNSNVSVSVFVNANDEAAAAAHAGTAAIAPVPGDVPSNTSSTSSQSSGSSSGKRNPDKKPALACIFCRGRKIACGPPPKDGDGKACNQCHRRSFRCEYPTESRRGMRKKPSNSSSTTASSSSTPLTTTSKASSNPNATGNSKSTPKSGAPKGVSHKKR